MMLRYDKKLNNCESINILPEFPAGEVQPVARQREVWRRGQPPPALMTAVAVTPQPHTTVVRPARAHPTCTRGVAITVNNIN